MRRLIFPLMILVFAAAFFGCSSGGGSVIVLLPDADGRVGKVEVSNSKGSFLMDRKYAAISLKKKQEPANPVIMPEQKINEIFGNALAAQPLPPANFLLNFHWSLDKLMPESLPVIQMIVADIRKRTSPHIIIRGHADRSGTTQINYKLSEKRAKKVKGLLVKEGIPADSIEISYHGEDEPLIWTADDVPKLLNRRVEVIVR